MPPLDNTFFIMDELLNLFNIKSEEDFKLKILEVLGSFRKSK